MSNKFADKFDTILKNQSQLLVIFAKDQYSIDKNEHEHEFVNSLIGETIKKLEHGNIRRSEWQQFNNYISDEVLPLICLLEINLEIASQGNLLYNISKKNSPCKISGPNVYNDKFKEKIQSPRALAIMRDVQHFLIVKVQGFYNKAKISDRYYLALFMESYLDSIVPPKDTKIDSTSTRASKELCVRFELIITIFSGLKTLGDLARLQRAQQLCLRHGLLSTIIRALAPPDSTNERKPTLKILIPALYISFYLAINQPTVSRRLHFPVNAVRAFKMCISAYGNMHTSVMSKEEQTRQVNIFVGTLFILSDAGTWINSTTNNGISDEDKEKIKSVWNEIPPITFIQEIFPIISEYTSTATISLVFEKLGKLFEIISKELIGEKEKNGEEIIEIELIISKTIESKDIIESKPIQTLPAFNQQLTSSPELKLKYALIIELYKSFIALGTRAWELAKVDSFQGKKPYYATILGVNNFYFPVIVKFPFSQRHINTYVSQNNTRGSLIVRNKFSSNTNDNKTTRTYYSSSPSPSMKNMGFDYTATLSICSDYMLTTTTKETKTDLNENTSDITILETDVDLNKTFEHKYLMAKLGHATLDEIKALEETKPNENKLHVIFEYDLTEKSYLPQISQVKWITHSELASTGDSTTLLINSLNQPNSNGNILYNGCVPKSYHKDMLCSKDTTSNTMSSSTQLFASLRKPEDSQKSRFLESDKYVYIPSNSSTFLPPLESTYLVQGVTYTTEEPFYQCTNSDVNRYGVLAAVQFTIIEAGEIGAYIPGISYDVVNDTLRFEDDGSITSIGIEPGSSPTTIGYDPSTGNLLYFNKKLSRKMSMPYGPPLSSSDRIIFALARTNSYAPIRIFVCINGIFLPSIDPKIFDIQPEKNDITKYIHPILYCASAGIKINASVMSCRWSLNRDSSRKLTLASFNPVAHFFYLAQQKSTVCPHFHAIRCEAKSTLDEWYKKIGKSTLETLLDEHPDQDGASFQTLVRVKDILDIATTPCEHLECTAARSYAELFKNIVNN